MIYKKKTARFVSESYAVQKQREVVNFKISGLGEGEELCLTESAIERFRSRIKETSLTKN